MNRLSVIIPVYNGEKYLRKTLESVVIQTVENFEVIIVDDGSTDSTPDISKSYCDEYNDFYYVRQEHSGVYAARNNGITHAKCEYLMFLDCGDVLVEYSIEALFKCADEQKADIITGRCWKNGDIEYEYDKSLDILASQPEIDKLETSLVKNGEIGAKAFKKKLFDLYNLRFRDLSANAELLFIMQAVFRSTKISGCPELVLDKSIRPIEDGYSQFEMPTYENLKSAAYVIDEIYKMGKDAIIEKTGSFDGDESYCREIVYSAYQLYIDKFYRRYWYMDSETLLLMKSEFEKYINLMTTERFKKLVKNNPDLRLPYIYTDKTEAASDAELSVLFDISDESEYLPFLRSLYAQTYPFFEVLVPRSKFDSDLFPEEFRKMENMRVLPDENFHVEARKQAKSKRIIELRGGTPPDIRAFSATAMSKTPAFMTQYVFAQKRQSLSARKTLKDKGLNLS